LIEPGYIVTNFQQTAKELAEPCVESARTSPYEKIYSGAWAGATQPRPFEVHARGLRLGDFAAIES
jgi:hypothetical protein